MASTRKKVFIALGVLVALGGVLFGVLVAVVVNGDHRAKAKAMALCDGTPAGMTADAALARARRSGSASRDPQWHAVDGGDELLVAFPAALPLTGYLCTISARDGVVTSTHVHAAD
jgi:hypothetical protein